MGIISEVHDVQCNGKISTVYRNTSHVPHTSLGVQVMKTIFERFVKEAGCIQPHRQCRRKNDNEMVSLVLLPVNTTRKDVFHTMSTNVENWQLKNLQELVHFNVCGAPSIFMYKYHQTLDFPNAKLVGNIERAWSQIPQTQHKNIWFRKISYYIKHYRLKRWRIIRTLKIIQNCFQTNLSATSLMGWTKILQWCQGYDNRCRESKGGMWRPICVVFLYTEKDCIQIFGLTSIISMIAIRWLYS